MLVFLTFSQVCGRYCQFPLSSLAFSFSMSHRSITLSSSYFLSIICSLCHRYDHHCISLFMWLFHCNAFSTSPSPNHTTQCPFLPISNLPNAGWSAALESMEGVCRRRIRNGMAMRMCCCWGWREERGRGESKSTPTIFVRRGSPRILLMGEKFENIMSDIDSIISDINKLIDTNSFTQFDQHIA